VFPLDEKFLAASIGRGSRGVAVGFDRLLMPSPGAETIAEVLPFRREDTRPRGGRRIAFRFLRTCSAGRGFSPTRMVSATAIESSGETGFSERGSAPGPAASCASPERG